MGAAARGCVRGCPVAIYCLLPVNVYLHTTPFCLVHTSWPLSLPLESWPVQASMPWRWLVIVAPNRVASSAGIVYAPGLNPIPFNGGGPLSLGTAAWAEGIGDGEAAGWANGFAAA